MRNTSEKKASSSKAAGNRFPRVVVAGIRGGSGKTTLSIGLISALRQKGADVVAFKKGPDYIDAGWLAKASGRPCYNLDPLLIGGEKNVLASFRHRFGDSDVAVIEGNRGIFDGMDEKGQFSTARLSQVIKAPVIAIIDCTKMTRTAAAVVKGIASFEQGFKLGGIVLNHISGARHEDVIRKSIARYTKIPVLGAIPRLLKSSAFPERHMGLTPFQEHPDVDAAIASAKEIVQKYVDVDAVYRLAKRAAPLPGARYPVLCKPISESVKIGVIRDSAFQFYYPENIEELEKAGAEIVDVSALRDREFPDMDCLYIGGGFPETHAIELSKNRRFIDELLRCVERGLPVYAECGGLMYLGRSIIMGENEYPMAGVFPIYFRLEKKPVAHGYAIAEAVKKNPFYKKGTVLQGHEFHYSRPIDMAGDLDFCLKMKRGKGISGSLDGAVTKNVFASYTHIHALGAPEWIEGMLKNALNFKKQRKKV